MTTPILGVSVLARRGTSVLLVKRGRPPLKDAWALPGGKVRLGERLADAAAREAMEETGVAVRGLRQIDIAELIAHDEAGAVSHFVVIVFAATTADGDARAGDDAAEARWVPLDDAFRLALAPDTAENPAENGRFALTAGIRSTFQAKRTYAPARGRAIVDRGA